MKLSFPNILLNDFPSDCRQLLKNRYSNRLIQTNLQGPDAAIKSTKFPFKLIIRDMILEYLTLGFQLPNPLHVTFSADGVKADKNSTRSFYSCAIGFPNLRYPRCVPSHVLSKTPQNPVYLGDIIHFLNDVNENGFDAILR